MKVDHVTMVSSATGQATTGICDVKLTDIDPDYQERHLVIFNLAGKTYGVEALFPQGSSKPEVIDLLNFVKGIGPKN